MISKARILIVDDEKLNIDVLASILSKDYELVIAKSGEKALKRIAAKKIDLVLLDIVMPEMNGYETFEKIRELPETNNIPIIFITSMRTPEEEIKGLKMGAVDYITKPFRPAIVQARVANQIVAKRNSDQLLQLNITDALTGIGNRRRFDSYFAEMRQLAIRSNTQLSLIMIDIDHFKQFNDNYGHTSGDICLRQVASALNKALERKVDLVARYGGEEFVVVLPNTDENNAVYIAQRLCTIVSSLAITHEYSCAAKHITISLGVATLSGVHAEQGEVDILKLADQALYQAKKNGRNQYCVAEHDKESVF